MGKKKVDVLILGAGFSGLCLAIRLHLEGISFQLVAHPDELSASSRAVGLVNPITGRRLALTWNFEQVIPAAHQFYKNAWKMVHNNLGSYLQPKTIWKALHSIEEMNHLSAKSADQGFDQLVEILASGQLHHPDLFQNTVGWAKVELGGRLDPQVFLGDLFQWFKSQGKLSFSVFDKASLINDASGFWRFQDVEAKVVVSCMGMSCPWIGSELWAVKGQIFKVSGLPEMGPDVFKTEKFIVPVGQDEALLGSTYEREFDSEEVTEAGWNEVTQYLKPEVKTGLRITQSWAGVRPTTKDRRPKVQELAPNLFSINGLGTKGVSLAPFAAAQLLAMPAFRHAIAR